MTYDERIEYVARASGAAGYEIIDTDGELVAWTVDGWWAAAIVDLLNDGNFVRQVAAGPDTGDNVR
jgi:hypothetical protein